jgi:recombination protein RecA
LAKQDEDFIKRMVNKYGKSLMITDFSLPEGISTDSISLDASIGVGGIPRSKFTEIYGPEGVAKTTIALHTARNALLKGYKVLYIDVENLLDITYAHAIIGGENKDFVVMQPDMAEDAFDIAEQGIESGNFQLIIFDSIGGLAPKKEKEDEFEDANVALVPRLMSKFIRRNETSVRVNNVAFLFINQVRDNVGSYTQGYSTPGGHALKHIATVIIQLNKGTPIKIGDDQIGAMVSFTTKKNKLAPPFRSFTIPIIYGKGIDRIRDLVMFGESVGILSKAGPYIKYGDQNLGRGMNDVSHNLMLPENSVLYEGIREKILDSVKKYKQETPLTDSEE